jgi:hypothetical protein
MTGTKVLLILLILIVVLFVVFVVWGAVTHSHEKETTADDFSNQPPPQFLDAFNGLLAPFGPTLKASSLSPALATFNFVDKPVYTITISSDSKNKFRQAKFVVQPETCAHVTYSAFDSKDADEKLRNQDSDKITKKSPPNQFTLTILEAGGTLVVARKPPMSPGACKVELQ